MTVLRRVLSTALASAAMCMLVASDVAKAINDDSDGGPDVEDGISGVDCNDLTSGNVDALVWDRPEANIIVVGSGEKNRSVCQKMAKSRSAVGMILLGHVDSMDALEEAMGMPFAPSEVETNDDDTDKNSNGDGQRYLVLPFARVINSPTHTEHAEMKQWKIDGAEWFTSDKAAVKAARATIDEVGVMSYIDPLNEMQAFLRSSWMMHRLPLMLVTPKDSAPTWLNALVSKIQYESDNVNLLHVRVVDNTVPAYLAELGLKDDMVPAFGALVPTQTDGRASVASVWYEETQFGKIGYQTAASFVISVVHQFGKDVGVKPFKGIDEDEWNATRNDDGQQRQSNNDSNHQFSKEVREINSNNYDELLDPEQTIGSFVIALLDGSDADAHEHGVNVLKEVTDIRLLNNRPVEYFTIDGACHKNVLEQLNLQHLQLPQVVMLLPNKMTVAHHQKAFTAKDIGTFVSDVLKGNRGMRSIDELPILGDNIDCQELHAANAAEMAALLAQEDELDMDIMAELAAERAAEEEAKAAAAVEALAEAEREEEERLNPKKVVKKVIKKKKKGGKKKVTGKDEL